MMKSNARLGRLLTDPKAYAQWWDLQDSLAVARRDSPLPRVEPDGFDPFWVLTKFDDIREVERQGDIFRQNGVRVGLHSRASLAEAESQPPTLSMVVFDGIDHQNLRGITAGWFGAARVKKLEERLRPLAKAAVAQMLAGGDTCEFSDDVALRYPLRVICSILGVPAEDEEIILGMTQKYFSSGRSAQEQNSPTNLDALKELSEYFKSMTNDRRRTPRDDIASVIANAVVGGDLHRSRARHGLLRHNRHSGARHHLRDVGGRYLGALRTAGPIPPVARATDADLKDRRRGCKMDNTRAAVHAHGRPALRTARSADRGRRLDAPLLSIRESRRRVL